MVRGRDSITHYIEHVTTQLRDPGSSLTQTLKINLQILTNLLTLLAEQCRPERMGGAARIAPRRGAAGAQVHPARLETRRLSSAVASSFDKGLVVSVVSEVVDGK